MARYFVTSEAQFEFSGGGLGAQVTTLHARIYVDATLKAVVGLGNGIQGIESPPGTWTYHIVDKELSFGAPPVPGTVSIDWFAQDAVAANADAYPTNTAPTLDVEAAALTIAVSSSTPTNNDTDVSTRNPIVLTFDATLDPTNLSDSLIALRLASSSVTMPIAVYINEDNATQLIVKPIANLPTTTLLELLIDEDAVYSLSGYRLAADYTLRFTTGEDDFESIEEATSEGVVERGAPIVLTGITLTPAPAATVTGSTPPEGTFNFTGTQVVIVYSEDLDPLVVPTITVTSESIFGLNEYYYVNDQLWMQSTAPTLPTVSNVDILADTLTIDFSGPFPGNGIITVTVSGLETDTNEVIDDHSITFTSELYPFRVGVPEVRNKIRRYVQSDITNELIAQMITEVGLNLFLRIGDKALLQQRCVIANEVALQLLDDYMAAQGGGMFAESKTLGAFSVSRKPDAAGLTGGIYGRLKDKLDHCEYELTSFFNAAVATIKSMNSPLERPNYRIRTWRQSQRAHDIGLHENDAADRHDTLPDVDEDWS